MKSRAVSCATDASLLTVRLLGLRPVECRKVSGRLAKPQRWLSERAGVNRACSSLEKHLTQNIHRGHKNESQRPPMLSPVHYLLGRLLQWEVCGNVGSVGNPEGGRSRDEVPSTVVISRV